MAGLYIHIPFCKRRCIYCDFYSTTLGVEVRQLYVNALCNELKQRCDYLAGESLATIYIGGGTPSQLSIAELKQLFRAIDATYRVNSNAEITMEANPDDLSEEYVTALRSLPINRLSIGVQTFREDYLQILNRRHTGKQALEAVKRCYKAGFQNISMDLIYGLPGQSLVDWQADLVAALSLPICHLSAYALIYEEGTVLWNLREQQKVAETDEDLSLQMFNYLIDETHRAQFEHYEISNFALSGKYSRHNSSYWDGTFYLGCGPSAHSYNGISRQWNTPDVHAYIKGQGNVVAAGLFELEQLREVTRFNDLIITSLRTARGLNLAQLETSFGDKYVSYVLRSAQPYIQAGTVELDEVKKTLRIMRSGIFVSDEIMSDLLWVEE
ncbi:MAG: radical SAM family heme chaperone HemW [Bacteroidaceae bacterium]